MIYSKPDNPKCNLCVYAQKIENSTNMQCEIKGTVPSDFCCRKFKYDIFKKKIKPKKTLKENSYTEEDFLI